MKETDFSEILSELRGSETLYESMFEFHPIFEHTFPPPQTIYFDNGKAFYRAWL